MNMKPIKNFDKADINSDRKRKIGLLILENQQISLMFLLIIICVIFSIISPKFLTKINIVNIIRQLSYVAIAGIGATILMIAGGIDLSIGSIQAFCGLLTVSTLVSTNNTFLAVVVGISSGLLVGLINGLFITKLKIPDIIATLAMMISLRGIDYLITDGVSIVNSTDTVFNKIGSGSILSIPIPIIIMVMFFIIFQVILKYTKLGRYFYAVGSSNEASLLSGIEVNKVKLIAYLISGLTAAMSAIILAARLNSGQPTAGNGFEFNVVSGVILGGCSLSGGSGNIIGSFMGLLLLTVLRNGFILVGLQSFWQEVLTGCIIIFSIWLNNYKNTIMSKNTKIM